jgi:hypothetical protein
VPATAARVQQTPRRAARDSVHQPAQHGLATGIRLGVAELGKVLFSVDPLDLDGVGQRDRCVRITASAAGEAPLSAGEALDRVKASTAQWTRSWPWCENHR